MQDLSKRPGNPTHSLEQHYHKLMAIQDPEELRQATLAVVEPMVGHGISDINFSKFVRNLNNSARRGIQGIQNYITQFILAGSGMGLAADGGVREDISVIASIISEDSDLFRTMTPQQYTLKEMVEQYGYKAILL